MQRATNAVVNFGGWGLYEQDIEEIREDYRRIEQEISEDDTQDVVVVSANSLKELKQAYLFCGYGFFLLKI